VLFCDAIAQLPPGRCYLDWICRRRCGHQLQSLKRGVTETELQIIQIDQGLRSDVGKDLADAQAKIAELVECQFAAEDQLKRLDIRVT